MRKLFIISILAIISWGCSQFSYTPTSLFWHNTNAKFNSLYIARDNMKIAEKAIFDARSEVYSQLMPILLPIDSTKNQALKANFDEVIKKTSMIAERHSNSHFLDEAYLLLGKARLYKGDFLNAIELFKYINTKGKNTDQKHASLIWLMRAYIEQKDYETALKVSETLKLLDLNQQNTVDFYLTKAYLHELRGEYNISVAIAEEALKLMKKGDMKARVEYASGQMYDMLAKPAQAEVHYAAAVKMHPTYDLEFYARMNTLLDEAAAHRGNASGLQNDFQAMLRDRKNKDLKDKIYFTMGSIEAKKENYVKAVEYYQKSIKNSSGIGQQKAYTYLELAELHYNQLQKYEKASAYYDSCLTALPKNSSDYERIYKRAISLSSFVKNQNIIKTEDSLQRLASMNPMALDKLLEKVIKDKEDEAKKLTEMAKKIASQNTNSSDLLDAGDDFKRWELYDPVLVARGKTDFIQYWGNRQLEDNWRRREKDAGSISVRVEKSPTDLAAPSKIQVVKKGEEVPLSKAEIAKNLENQKKEMYDKIPTTPEKLEASNKRLEEAYYQLGKIYKLQFNEPENAQSTFQTLLSKFPKTQHEPEVLYFLTLLSPNPESSPYRTGLLAKYPTSTYARQMLRGNVNITSDMEAQANQVYNRVFNLYSQAEYEMALKEADDGLIKFTGTTIEDKFAMIRILLLAKSQQKDQYTQALKEFTQSYPNSNLMKRAKEMLAIVEKK